MKQGVVGVGFSLLLILLVGANSIYAGAVTVDTVLRLFSIIVGGIILVIVVAGGLVARTKVFARDPWFWGRLTFTSSARAHVSCEYADRSGQRNCVRNTAAPDDVDAKTTVNFVGGESVYAIIPHDGSITYGESTNGLLEQFQKWKRPSHILRQDEVADFIEKTKGQKYSALIPLLGLSKYEDIFGNFEGLERAVVERSDLDTIIARRKWIKEELENKVGFLEQDKIILTFKEKGTSYGVGYTDLDTSSETAVTKVKEAMEELQPGILRHRALKKIHDSQLVETIEKLRAISKEAYVQITEQINIRLRLLEQAQNYLSSDDKDEIELCPVCGAEVEKTELDQHIKSELEKLKEFRKISDEIRTSKLQITRLLDALSQNAADEALEEWLEAAENAEIKRLLSETSNFGLPDIDSEWSEKLISDIIDVKKELDKLLEPLIEDDPPSTTKLQQDLEFFENAPRIIEYEDLSDRISKVEKLCNALKKTQENIRTKINEITEETLERITGDVQSLWKIIHEDDPIEEITLVKSVADRAIDITLKFYGTDQQSPILHLSEGYRNSLGLCVFLALAKQEPLDHPLILDDIVSSLDRDHRAFIVDVLITELDDKQVLLFTHDAEWFRELNRRLDPGQWKFYSLKAWDTPERGIIVEQSRFSFDEVRSYLPDKPEAAGTAVRTLMDHELSRISQKLEIPFPYIDGPKNDFRGPVLHIEAILERATEKYKIQNGSGWEIYTDPHTIWKEAFQLLVEWANRGSHTGTLTVREVERLIDCCQETLGYFNCPDCGKPIWMLDKGTDYKRCDCGKLRWNL